MHCVWLVAVNCETTVSQPSNNQDFCCRYASFGIRTQARKTCWRWLSVHTRCLARSMFRPFSYWRQLASWVKFQCDAAKICLVRPNVRPWPSVKGAIQIIASTWSDFYCRIDLVTSWGQTRWLHWFEWCLSHLVVVGRLVLRPIWMCDHLIERKRIVLFALHHKFHATASHADCRSFVLLVAH